MVGKVSIGWTFVKTRTGSSTVGYLPVMDFARTSTTDAEIRGTTIQAGEKVPLFYCSGNRDESVFDQPGSIAGLRDNLLASSWRA